MTHGQQKKKGSYYTPSLLADFMVYHIFKEGNFNIPKAVSILEPSVGDGIFFKAILANKNFKGKKHYIPPTDIKLTAVETEVEELSKAKKFTNNFLSERIHAQFEHADFLDYYLVSNDKFDLVIGNPPYIKKDCLSKKQISACEKIHKQAGLSPKKIKNIWTSFLIGAVKSITEKGVVALVLPAELLQVIYAKELRDLLKEEFSQGKIDIFSFNELIFRDIEQDVIVLICSKQHDKPGTSFYHVDKLQNLKEPNYTKDNSNIHRTTLDKWTNYILSDNDLKFLDKIKSDQSLLAVEDYAQSVAGLVTAANSYFIVNSETVASHSLSKIAKTHYQKKPTLTLSTIYARERFLTHDRKRPTMLTANV